MDNHGFKVPHTIPQDLLLIQELIGVPLPGPSSTSTNTIQSAAHGAASLLPTTNQSSPVVDLVPGSSTGGAMNDEDISSSDEEGEEKEKIQVQAAKELKMQIDEQAVQVNERPMDVDTEKPSGTQEKDKVVQKTKEQTEEEEDAASEEEIAADLIEGTGTDEDDLLVKSNSKDGRAEPASSSSDSSSESSSASDSSSSSVSDSDDDDEPASKSKIKSSANDEDDLGLDEDENPLPSTSGYYTTKHEVPETEAPITVPDVTEVGAEEVLEKVGEVMNVVELTKSVIVRGLPTDDPTMTRASDKALDSDTLLVFEDRKVLGYIYETFGPTTQPFYLIKFSSSFPLDPGLVTVGRSVFNVPARSRFVFVSQIKAIKGSDASNVHDEEPADDELEFSDDEKEAEWRSRLKRKRGENRARSSSVVSSRQSTPNPTHMRDQELASADREEYISRNPYDEHGPYDIDYPSTSTSAVPSAGPSSLGGRMPVPYDDPYGEEYTAPDVVDREMGVPSASGASGPSSSNTHSRGRGRGGGGGRERDRGRGRGRDRERGRGGGGGSGGRGARGGRYGNERQTAQSDDAYDNATINGRAVSPTSMAIARATGTGYGFSGQSQYGYGAGGGLGQEQYRPQQYYRQQQSQSSSYQQPEIPGLGGYGGSSGMSWGYQNQMLQNNWPSYGYQQHQGYGGQGAGVQPHINPRFGFPPTSGTRSPTWDGTWPIPSSNSSGQSGSTGDTQYSQSHSAWE